MCATPFISMPHPRTSIGHAVFRQTCLAQALQVALQLFRILDIEKALARERARKIRLPKPQIRKRGGQLAFPVQVSEGRDPMGERPIVTIGDADRLLCPLEGVIELTGQEMRERSV